MKHIDIVSGAVLHQRRTVINVDIAIVSGVVSTGIRKDSASIHREISIKCWKIGASRTLRKTSAKVVMESGMLFLLRRQIKEKEKKERKKEIEEKSTLYSYNFGFY